MIVWIVSIRHLVTQQTSPMPIQCRSTAYDADPAPNQHCQCQYVVSIEQQLTSSWSCQASTRCRPNTGSTSCACPAWIWASIYIQSKHRYNGLPVQCWSTVDDNGPSSNQQGIPCIPGSSWLWLKKKTRDAGQSLFRRWTKTSPTAKQASTNVSHSAQETRCVEAMLLQSWPTVYNAGPTPKQHRFNAPGHRDYIEIREIHRTARQPWRNAGPTPQTVDQHYPTVGSPPHACCDTLILQIMKNNIPFTQKDLIFVSSFCCIFFQGKYSFQVRVNVIK